ncbi:MAG: hypothetical protein AAGB29_09515 [Planctomycetota bacterium]
MGADRIVWGLVFCLLGAVTLPVLVFFGSFGLLYLVSLSMGDDRFMLYMWLLIPATPICAIAGAITGFFFGLKVASKLS